MSFKPTITYDDFAKLDLRVATIVQAEPHPNADRLLKVQIDLGEEQRQICAGIRQFVGDPAELVGKQVIVVANLAPRKIRGEDSNGMLLAASVVDPPAAPGTEGEQGEGTLKDIVVLQPSKPTPPGSKVS
jgi:tRNA-binding protein